MEEGAEPQFLFLFRIEKDSNLKSIYSFSFVYWIKFVWKVISHTNLPHFIFDGSLYNITFLLSSVFFSICPLHPTSFLRRHLLINFILNFKTVCYRRLVVRFFFKPVRSRGLGKKSALPGKYTAFNVSSFEFITKPEESYKHSTWKFQMKA